MSIVLPNSYTKAQAATWDDYYNSPQGSKGLLLKERLELATELIVKHVNPENGRIADLGCGAGQLTVELVRRGFSVAAFDYSSEMLALAAGNWKQATDARTVPSFFKVDLNEFDFNGLKFGGIGALGCLEFLRDFPKTAERIVDALIPGGCLVMSMPNVYSPFVWPERLARISLQIVRSRESLRHNPIGYTKVKRLMRQLGMEDVERRFTFAGTFIGDLGFPPISLLSRAFTRQVFSGTRYTGNTWVAAFRKRLL